EDTSPGRVVGESGDGKSHERKETVLCESQPAADAGEERAVSAARVVVHAVGDDGGGGGGGGDPGAAIFFFSVGVVEADGGLLAGAEAHLRGAAAHQWFSQARGFVDYAAVF